MRTACYFYLNWQTLNVFAENSRCRLSTFEHANNLADKYSLVTGYLRERSAVVDHIAIYEERNIVYVAGTESTRSSADADANPRDAFRGQSRSSNIVPFHMLGIVSY